MSQIEFSMRLSDIELNSLILAFKKMHCLPEIAIVTNQTLEHFLAKNVATEVKERFRISDGIRGGTNCNLGKTSWLAHGAAGNLFILVHQNGNSAKPSKLADVGGITVRWKGDPMLGQKIAGFLCSLAALAAA